MTRQQYQKELKDAERKKKKQPHPVQPLSKWEKFGIICEVILDIILMFGIIILVKLILDNFDNVMLTILIFTFVGFCVIWGLTGNSNIPPSDRGESNND